MINNNDNDNDSSAGGHRDTQKLFQQQQGQDFIRPSKVIHTVIIIENYYYKWFEQSRYGYETFACDEWLPESLWSFTVRTVLFSLNCITYTYTRVGRLFFHKFVPTCSFARLYNVHKDYFQTLVMND